MTPDFTIEDMRQVFQEEIQRMPIFNKSEDELLPRKVAAQILNVKENTLAVWAMEGRGPAPTKIGTRSMYRRSVLKKYIIDHTMPR
jgi:hypothetical protein